jgi:hypothetical protein
MKGRKAVIEINHDTDSRTSIHGTFSPKGSRSSWEKKGYRYYYWWYKRFIPIVQNGGVLPHAFIAHPKHLEPSSLYSTQPRVKPQRRLLYFHLPKYCT